LGQTLIRMHLSCNFVNMYMIAYRVQYTFTRIHVRIPNGQPREDPREEKRRVGRVGEQSLFIVHFIGHGFMLPPIFWLKMRWKMLALKDGIFHRILSQNSQKIGMPNLMLELDLLVSTLTLSLILTLQPYSNSTNTNPTDPNHADRNPKP